MGNGSWIMAVAASVAQNDAAKIVDILKQDGVSCQKSDVTFHDRLTAHSRTI